MFGSKMWVDQADLAKLMVRLTIDLFFAGIVIYVVYYKLYKNREYLFTYFLFNIITFCLCFLLRKVPIELGFALGLFAVFGILRYRTEPIRIRDLTYLFIVIGLGILNALANKKVSVAEVLVVNSVIVGMTAVLELGGGRSGDNSVPILYDNLALLKPSAKAELYKDLQERIGAEVIRVQVQRIDMLRDAAELVVFYRTGGAERKAA